MNKKSLILISILVLALVTLDSGTANPLSVKVSMDESTAATALITTAGGSLSATAADGTVFNLTLPADALFSDEQITLTPLTSVDGLPLSGGFVEGVQLSPDGLQLLEPATLTISTPKAALSGDLLLVGFAYHRAGEEFYLTPTESTGTTITMRVTHFSGRGAGKGTNADVKKQQKEHPPSSPADDMDQLLVDLVPPDEPVSLMPASLHEWWQKKGLETRLDAASTDETLLEPGLAEFLQFLDKVEENKLEGEFAFEIEAGWGFLGNGVVNAVNNAYAACVNENDISQIENILRWTEWAARWPQMLKSIGSTRMSEFKEKVRKCLSFELEFDSTITRDAPAATGTTWQVRSTIPIQAAGDDLKLMGAAPLNIVSVEWVSHISGVGVLKIISSTAIGGTFQVNSLTLFSSNIRADRGPNAVVPTLYFNPGKTSETVVQQACNPYSCGPETTNTGAFWSEIFQILHKDEITTGGYWIRDWNPGSGATLGRKDYDRSIGYGGATLTEKTSFTLRHKP
jgi:hypothetical protein